MDQEKSRNKNDALRNSSKFHPEPQKAAYL